MYKKLYTYNVYNQINWDISIDPRNYYQNQCRHHKNLLVNWPLSPIFSLVYRYALMHQKCFWLLISLQTNFLSFILVLQGLHTQGLYHLRLYFLPFTFKNPSPETCPSLIYSLMHQSLTLTSEYLLRIYSSHEMPSLIYSYIQILLNFYEI